MLQVGLSLPRSPGGAAAAFPMAEPAAGEDTGTGQGECAERGPPVPDPSGGAQGLGQTQIPAPSWSLHSAPGAGAPAVGWARADAAR